MSVQSVALASLTATYTDSEGDEGLDDELDLHHHHHHHQHKQQQQQQSKLQHHHPSSSPPSPSHQHHHHRRRESAETPKFDDIQNSNVSSRQITADSPLFGRSKTNSPDDDYTVRGNDTADIENNRKIIKYKKNNAPTLVTDVTSKVQRLVSYFDDTIVSDDDMGTVTGFDDRTSDDNIASFSLTKNMMRITNAQRQSPKRQGVVISDNDDDDLAWGVTIPPEPIGNCTTELQDKISNLYRKMEHGGLDMNVHIQQRKEFRNPSIYEKLIQFCSINEMGTNYPPDRFDPFKWGKDSYYEELARIQKTEMDKLEKARKEKTKIEIVTGTAKRPSSVVNSATNSEDDAKRRKSKWDQVATGTNSSVKSSVAGTVAQPALTTLTSSATGTKATVISAFGSLPKKRL